MLRRKPGAVVLTLAGAAIAGALSQAQQQPVAPRAPAAPAGQVRDPTGRGNVTTAKTGTGVISGLVSVANSGQPSWGARVMLSSAEINGSRTAMTDNSGRFSFSALPAGRYTLSVNKPGYVNVMYGQRRVGSGGTPIALRDGEQRDVSIALPRGGVITGMIVDERGEPAINVSVRGMRFMLMNGQRRLQQNSGATTDDRGVYRLHSLQPGEYAVCASARNIGPQTDAQRIQMELESLRRTLENPNGPPASVRQSMTARMTQLQAQLSEQVEPVTGYAPVCYPGGGTNMSTPILVAAGDERAGIDLQLHLTPVARVEGTVVIPQGLGAQNIQIMMANADEAMADTERQGTRVENNGKFRFQNIAPGRYVITARTMPMGPQGGPAGNVTGRGNTPPPEPKLWGIAEINVNGQDLDVVLDLQRGATVSGQIVFQPTTLQPPPDLTRAQVSVFPFSPSFGGLSLDSNAQGTVDATGRFTIPDVFPGKYRVSAGVPGAQGWIVDSIAAGGQDALDFPLEVKPGQNVSGLVITMGDRPTELSGTIVNEKGEPALEHTVLLYPVEQKYWTPQSRRIRVTRAGSDGTYLFRALPPGDYRMTTLIDPEPGSWYDRDLLEQLDTSSVRITLLEGEKKVEHVRVRSGG